MSISFWVVVFANFLVVVSSEDSCAVKCANDQVCLSTGSNEKDLICMDEVATMKVCSCLRVLNDPEDFDRRPSLGCCAVAR